MEQFALTIFKWYFSIYFRMGALLLQQRTLTGLNSGPIGVTSTDANGCMNSNHQSLLQPTFNRYCQQHLKLMYCVMVRPTERLIPIFRVE